MAPDAFSFPTLEQYYRALDVVCEHKDLIERHVYAAVCDLTNLNLTLACYDLKSSYLEGEVAGHGRFPSKAFGFSRDRRSDRPQVVIGLLTSADGIPIAHHVFAGGTQDATTLKGVLDDLVARFAVGRICVVADRGLITDDNIAEVESANCDLRDSHRQLAHTRSIDDHRDPVRGVAISTLSLAGPLCRAPNPCTPLICQPPAWHHPVRST